MQGAYLPMGQQQGVCGGQNSPQQSGQERILATSWHPLSRVPKREPMPEHHRWTDVRVEEEHISTRPNVPWSDVRVLVSVLRSYLEYMRILGGYFPVSASG